jgi:hypothetical protein
MSFFLLKLSSSYSIFLFLSVSFFFPVYLSTSHYLFANFLPFLSYSYVISISAIVNLLLTKYYGHNASNGDELPVSNQGPDEGDVGGAKGRTKCQNGTEHAPRVTRWYFRNVNVSWKNKSKKVRLSYVMTLFI